MMRGYVTPAASIDMDERKGKLVAGAVILAAVGAIGIYAYANGFGQGSAPVSDNPPPAIQTPMVPTAAAPPPATQTVAPQTTAPAVAPPVINATPAPEQSAPVVTHSAPVVTHARHVTPRVAAPVETTTPAVTPPPAQVVPDQSVQPSAPRAADGDAADDRAVDRSVRAGPAGHAAAEPSRSSRSNRLRRRGRRRSNSTR